MGNYVSCTLLGPMGKGSSRVTKVIFPSGELRPLHDHTKAAELMLEVPNSFVVNTKSLQIGKRFNALNANEDLEMGNVYVFFPMSRLNAVVTAADMGSLFLAANSSASRGRVRILPEYCGAADMQIVKSVSVKREPPPPPQPPQQKLINFDDIEEFSSPEFKNRLSMCRSKKPLLETIVEEPFFIR